MTPALSRLCQHLRAAADAIEELAHEDDLVDQHASPLGRRAHLEAVRRGSLKGSKVGRRVLVRRRDLDAYIEQRGRRPVASQEQIDEEREIDAIVNRRAG